ncbi:hypothetical protein [Streptomyces californicus]|uniref:hypothetical protein n=1 Tax=Streptomyces californicus TaxID=67351 RepID=UPI0038118495
MAGLAGVSWKSPTRPPWRPIRRPPQTPTRSPRSRAAQQAAGENQDNALALLHRTPEAEAEARRAYKAEQGRDARARVAEHLLAARLEQLRGLSAALAGKPASWAERLPGLAARPLDGDATGPVIA